MPGTTVKIRATEGGEFDCYLAMPAGGDTAPAVVLASAIHGVDADIRQIADEFAAAGFIAAAPDLFWRTSTGAARPRRQKGRGALAAAARKDRDK